MSELSLPPAHRQFLQIARLPDCDLTTEHLVEAAFCIAAQANPSLDIPHYLARLEAMAADLRLQLAEERYPLRLLRGINHYLFNELGFQGNRKQYYDPRNSFLNEVIDRRLGIPITLSILYMALGERVGLPLEGVNFPGHFILRPTQQDLEIYVDPFEQGEILFQQDCQERLNQITGPLPLKPEYLATVGPRRILSRVLTNLKFIYLNQGDLERVLSVVEWLLLLDPDALEHLRDRGLLYYQSQRYLEARADLELYLDRAPQASDIAVVARLLERLRQL
ncbi:SirB1 family protein [Leptolyngbya sp. FACHB-261]|uniref:SirB1 family protein n=1 Tax=Leptolyngbya sp. FACHB-261 TaxID=2692806 RepID=UPI0016864150|nr:transglutaminase-like domain-containing protein [Leptolyngbya sp. FACHB-261]MBD2103826.1 tetratricopeptide repeat protein [Leptolyngbya sp. FACHB-261]